MVERPIHRAADSRLRDRCSRRVLRRRGHPLPPPPPATATAAAAEPARSRRRCPDSNTDASRSARSTRPCVRRSLSTRPIEWHRLQRSWVSLSAAVREVDQAPLGVEHDRPRFLGRQPVRVRQRLDDATSDVRSVICTLLSEIIRRTSAPSSRESRAGTRCASSSSCRRGRGSCRMP